MRFRIIVAVVLAFVLSASLVSAHGMEESPLKNLPDPITMLYYALWISGLATLASLVFRLNRTEKRIAYIMIAVPVALSTFYLAAHTVYLNIVSESQGPVHWHADYEVWVCGEKLDLANPMGFENRVGSPVFHEHDDDRMHVEGVLVKVSDARLEKYFEAVGGELTADGMSYPTNAGVISVKNNDLCNGVPGKIQVFVYKTIDNRHHQEKIEDFLHYVLSPYSQVPLGDCIIIEFDIERDRTGRICSTYQAAINKGDIIGG